ncbi:entericidin A/B family lipoprotein [Thalassospira lucentensis]
MTDFLKKFLAVAMITGMGFGLAACETAEGFGKDMEDAGEAIQEEAD